MAGLDIGSQVQEEMYRRGIRQPSSPFIEDIASVAEKTAAGVKSIGKGLVDTASDVTMKGLTALGVGAAGASDYFTGTNLMPGIGKEFTKSWGLNETNLPASAKPLTAPATQNMGLTQNTSPARTESDIMKEIQATRVPSLGLRTEKPAGWIRNETGEVINVPKAEAQPQDINAQIDDLVNKLTSSPESRVTQSMGLGQGVKTGGLKKKVLDNIVELRKAQLGLAGHKITADIATDIRQQALDEKIRYNNVLEKEFNLKMEQQKDVARQKSLDTMLSTWGYHEADPMNPGNKVMNRKITYFNLGESGEDVPQEIAPAVKRITDEFEDFYKRGLAKGKQKPSSALRSEAKALWMRKNLIFSPTE